MRVGVIPNCDLRPSVIALGALPFGSSLPQETAFALMDAFVAAGGSLIDTALVYGAWLPGGQGLSEQTIGAWITARRGRDRIILSTKGGHPHLTTMESPRLSAAELNGDLDESLHNLRTDHIDLYWVHRDDPTRPVAEILETLQGQAQAGKIRAFGCSNWRVERMQAAQDYAAAHHIDAFAGHQLMWSLAVPNAEGLTDPTMTWMDERMYAYHRASDLPAMAYSAQAQGFFSKLERTPLESLPAALRAVYSNAINLARYSRLKALANELSLPVSVVALAYITSHPFPAYAIAGCSALEQLGDNLLAGDVVLPAAAVTYLESGQERGK
jgi:aryl-alcohol dehydrogenase-like predicted oxidoreductase